MTTKNIKGPKLKCFTFYSLCNVGTHGQTLFCPISVMAQRLHRFLRQAILTCGAASEYNFRIESGLDNMRDKFFCGI